MRQFMNKLVEEKASLRNALLATVNFLFWLWLIDFSPIGVSGLLKVTGGVNILDFESGYSVKYAYTLLSNLGEAGRMFHLTKIMPLDILFPFSLMLFGVTWFLYLLNKVTLHNCVLRFLPLFSVLNMLLDWTENIGIVIMILNYPKQLPGVCHFTATVSSIKFCCVKFIAVALALLTIALIFKKIYMGIRKCIGKSPKK